MKTRWILSVLSIFTLSLAYGDFGTAGRAMAQYDQSYDSWEQRFTYTQDDETRLQLLKTRPEARRTTQTIIKSIGTQLNDPQSLRAIAWIYANDSQSLNNPKAPETGKAIRSALMRSHFNQAGAGDLCITISQNFSPLDLPFLEKVAKQASNEIEQGLASLSVSVALSSLGSDSELVAKRLEYLRTAIKTIPTEKQVNGKKVTDIISDQLYVIRFLSKGRKAPDFAGKDVTGAPISLTSAKGKVTALVFWSAKDVSKPSQLEFLQSMQSRLSKVGGEMIGIYTGELGTLRQKLADREATWKNAFDGSGEITKQFRISQTPAVFLLDKTGKIHSIGEPNTLINLSIQALADSTE